jgi:hypothetical protein
MPALTEDDLATLRTRDETALDMHVSLATLKRIIAAGEIDVVRIRGRVFVTRRAVLDYLNRSTVRAEQPRRGASERRTA